MHKKIILLLSLHLYSFNIYAMNLEEALISGYNHSEDFQIIRSDFLSEIEKFPSALASFMPQISASIQSTNTQVKSNATNPITNTKTNNFSNKNRAYDKSLTIKQSIFNGGASVAALKSAQESFMASMGGYYTKEQEIFTNHISAYLACVTAKQKLDIAKISVHSNKTQLEAVKEKFKFGESTETEVASSESALADAEANQAIALANYEAGKANFVRVFAIEAIDLKMPDLPKDLPDNLEKFTELAIANNPKLNQARNSTKSAKAEEYVSKAALLPQVSAQFSAGNTQQAFNNKENNKSISSVISVNIPILSRGGAEYSDIRRAKQQTRRTAISLDSQIKSIKSECRAAFEEFKASNLRIAATKEAVRSAEIAYNGTIQEERLGSKTLLDILNTEERLNKARSNNVDAQGALVISAYKIKALLGALTAKSMQLPVQYFEPEQEFKKVKMKIVGF